MNRMLTQFRYSFYKKLVDIFGEVAIGASGAPTLTTANSKGIASISRTSAGLYVLTLSEAVNKILDLHVMFLDATDTTCPQVKIVSRTTSVITFLCLGPTDTADTALTATDPADGDTMLIHLIVNDTSAI